MHRKRALFIFLCRCTHWHKSSLRGHVFASRLPASSQVELKQSCQTSVISPAPSNNYVIIKILYQWKTGPLCVCMCAFAMEEYSMDAGYTCSTGTESRDFKKLIWPMLIFLQTPLTCGIFSLFHFAFISVCTIAAVGLRRDALSTNPCPDRRLATEQSFYCLSLPQTVFLSYLQNE